MLVTASDDGTVWFFSLLIEEGQFSVAPLGFAVYGEPGETVTGLEFVPGSEKKFLLFTGAGRVLEMRTPGVKDLTDHTTYVNAEALCAGLQVKSEILREEARLAREAEKDKQRSELQADIDERKKLGLEVDENTEKAKLEKRLALEDRELPEIPLVVPEPPSPVLVGVPAADGTFTLLMGGWDAGWVHSASFKEARPTAVRVPGAEQVGVSFRTFSADGKYMVLGLVDGRIRIHAVHEDPWALDDYWHLHMHDNTYGRITGICFSYDGRNLITCGTDGNIFLFDFVPPEGIARPRSSKFVIGGQPEERVDDIDDGSTYSLEEQRQRSALDARQQLADARKAAVRADLAELRREFKQWIGLNQGLPRQVALSHAELLLDERIRAEQRRKAEESLQTGSDRHGKNSIV
ncbi:Cilia- and flagella-associated protein 44 [Amphibalanus amphitrite]|uniref:Cilia-and flagella-associated protein 44 n=1 Tax=Amphibalanus amphitrite TaxID=1232801 RepID=A0A6A4W111_AMPAM|nr:Cilia- and flagella-associated protein 44 [Amphibalanus amphitrite]